LKLEELLKGHLIEQSGDLVKIEAKQVRNRFSLQPPPGVWSNIVINPGTRLVAFGASTSSTASAVVNDPDCLLLVPAGEALTEVRLALQNESNFSDLGRLLSSARPAAQQLGWLFGDYLWARHGAEAMADITKFNEIATFLEEPKLGKDARTTMLMAITTQVAMQEPPNHIDRLAITLFRLLNMPEAEKLHDNLVGTYLPNLLGLNGGVSLRRPSDVFRQQPTEREKAERATRSYKGQQPVAPLLDWFKK
jgi:hypothetical protein